MEAEERVKLLRKARSYWIWGLIFYFPLFFLFPIGFVLRYLATRLVAKLTNNYEISCYYGLGLLLFFIPFVFCFLVAKSLREVGRELNSAGFIKAAKYYFWCAIGWVATIFWMSLLAIVAFRVVPLGAGGTLTVVIEMIVWIVRLFVFVTALASFIYEIASAWRLAEVSEEMNSSEIEQKEE
jgi:hypothetical protein